MITSILKKEENDFMDNGGGVALPNKENKEIENEEEIRNNQRVT